MVVPNLVTLHLGSGEAVPRRVPLADLPLLDLVRRLAREP